MLVNKNILLGLTGSIACYKAAEICRLLRQAGAQVQVVMTTSATRFLAPMTMEALSGRVVVLSPWEHPAPGVAHVDLARWADGCLVAPCSANFLARIASGLADDALALACLARKIPQTPLWLAPAMNCAMWAHPATQRNLRQVAADGAVVLGVGTGPMACNEEGEGRMLEPAQIVEALQASFQPKLLAGQRVVISAGPTFEAMDPVRGLTNRSSGKMGFALARACHEAGADVILVSGPVALETPDGVRRIDVVSALDMHSAVVAAVQDATVFIATAAVADWRCAEISDRKLKKGGSDTVTHSTAHSTTYGAPSLHLVENPDILASIAHSSRAQEGKLFCVGFAAETENLCANAQAKRVRKGVPMLVANLAQDAIGTDACSLTIVDADGLQALPRADKPDLARELVAQIARRLQSGAGG
ncbi:phosphopantothenoylcysteine synthase [Candidatus Symbiobacter mobilis CR]|uniref:Coenzyme A biosynthesis bifunctional protein CoaBC n=2 Tax=Candidatus Symbiobacter TaxID=1436289 RepID=U5N8B4_9BURK|nr:phosphopantothenoylcysteine synthase [Candidatus Symbiobacter mobilis CR]